MATQQKVIFSILFLQSYLLFAQNTPCSNTAFDIGNKTFSIFENIDTTAIKNSRLDKIRNYNFLNFIIKNNSNDVESASLSILPLFAANVGFDSQKNQIVNETGLGFMLNAKLKNKLFLNLKIYQGNGSFPTFVDSVIGKTNIMPYAGFAHSLPNGRYYFWNNSFELKYKANRFFAFSLANDRNFFGDGYRSLLLSNNGYNYPHVKIEANIWKFKYKAIFANFYDVHFSTGNYEDFKNKYGAIHYLQWKVLKKLQVSFFEAIMFQSRTQKGFGYDINYLNPLIFYRPVEYSLGSADNALIGGNLVWAIKHNTSIYGQIILDEFLLSAVKARKGWIDNKQGFQLGVKTNQHFGKHYFNLLAEINYVRPFVYSHRNTIQNFANYSMPLAHPYGANFYEILVSAKYRTPQYLQVNITTSYSVIGYDLNGISYGQNINNSYLNRIQYNTLYEGNKVGQGLTTKQVLLQCKALYVINKSLNMCANAGFMIRGIANVNYKQISAYPFIGFSTTVFKDNGIY